MMGQQVRTESLFYYFRLQDQIPEDHLLRLVDRYVDFSFVRERLKDSYSSTGRPSIDPEVLLRLLLVGYLYGITSERRLLEEVRMHLAYRWFTRLGFEQELPDHSTFSKNRHGRFRQSGIFREVFEEIARFFDGHLHRQTATGHAHPGVCIDQGPGISFGDDLRFGMRIDASGP